MLLRNDGSTSPEVEECIDVVVEWIRRGDDFEYVMNEDVRQERPHEEQRRRTRILDSNDTGLTGAPEIARHDLQPAPGRTVLGPRIERHDQRRIRALVHAEHEMLHDRRPRERHPLLGHSAQNHPRVRRSVDALQIEDALRQLHVRVHGRFEERLLGVEVPEDRRGSDAKLAGDVGQSGRGEALHREDAAGGQEDLLAADGGRPSHL